MNVKELGEKLRALFARRGYSCDGCGAEVFDYPAKRICKDCQSLLFVKSAHTCPKCGRKTVAEGVCLTCKKELPEFKRGLSPFAYETAAASMVNRLKNGERHLAFFFAEEMSRLLAQSEEFFPDLLVVCVPMTERKRTERGYNQAEELAKIVARLSGLEFDGEVLQKRKETSEQKHLTRKERQENVETAFFVHKRKAIRGRRLLLIDDIMTTGATGNACARALKNAGASEVIFLTALSLSERK